MCVWPCSVCSDVPVVNWRRSVRRADSSSWPRSQWSAASGANASGTNPAQTPSAACSERDSRREPRPAHGSRPYGPGTPGTLRHTQTDGFMRENWTEGHSEHTWSRTQKTTITQTKQKSVWSQTDLRVQTSSYWPWWWVIKDYICSFSPFSAPTSSRRSISRNLGLSGRNGRTHSCSRAGNAKKANRKFHLFSCKSTSDVQRDVSEVHRWHDRRMKVNRFDQ